MKKLTFFFLSLLISAATAGFAENFVLDNETSYPNKSHPKMAVQWAYSAKEVNQNNNAMISGFPTRRDNLQKVKQTGEVSIKIPRGAEYFRVLVWSKTQDEPELITNWVDVVPNKTYTLQSDHLTPTSLMLGMGC